MKVISHFIQLQQQPINISKVKKAYYSVEEGKQYQNVSEITRTAGLVHR
ncbi:MAG: hypothetical protein M3044_06435 [Thermoproteota archaeon]|nr:hypothetical protein [Thermoproteota archaeon]